MCGRVSVCGVWQVVRMQREIRTAVRAASAVDVGSDDERSDEDEGGGGAAGGEGADEATPGDEAGGARPRSVVYM